MVQAVLGLAAVAEHHACVGKVSAKLALVAVFRRRLAVEHYAGQKIQLLQVAAWRKTLLFVLQDLLNVDAVLTLNTQPVLVCLGKRLDTGLIKLGFVQVDDVLDHEPLEGKNRNFLTSQSVDVLGLNAIGEPGLRSEVYCLSNIEAGAETRMVTARQSKDKFSRFLKCFENTNLNK